ncbi:hypothetical protein AYY19_12700 [Photobacterium aquimaris]|uniref:DUF979 domain-containing protein n=1 Tax=Photobacterium aquimaris TaxID=512643 RepID=A0A2T3IQK6_9GAMM|nr:MULTISPECIES: DUF979 domain-containing protein [Photobacterium]OBU17059.1 hypothetical protein AYY20_05315 [Photobacterium aquimaris]OBU17520.1 hypothetical protein AYY19_12700 [Photobacterium aquimaris]PSU30622.1 DUF979 domain-containing protein [Photobacterium aquimaris]PSV98949.1 DUF979 domain-containing protein [Photobacterium aquimaris]
MLEYVYQTTGLLLIAFAIQSFADKSSAKRWGTGAFWLIYGITFMCGPLMPHWVTGLLVLALTLLATGGFMGVGSYNTTDDSTKAKSAITLKNKLFIPAVLIPIGTIVVSQCTDLGALTGLGISSVLAIGVALVITKGTATQSINEGRRLIDGIGWAAILSQFLAALGYLFSQAGVGDTVSQLVKMIVPDNNLQAYVVAYCVGMMLFTIVMGNGFAAFAVITTGIGIPLLIIEQGGNPAIVGVLGMLSGYCGTLMTPMAANFNVVPAALLELKNKNQIIMTQFLPGLVMLAFNIVLMYTLAF